MSNNPLKDKKILITAGPTWVSIDRVRVITSIFGGRLGPAIAQKAAQFGGEVTLLLGRSRADISLLEESRVSIKRFVYFDDLKKMAEEELGSKAYDIIIHSAAVSDYRPCQSHDGKIASKKDSLSIDLVPTIKIVDEIRKQAPSAFLVKFKLEVGKTKEELLDIGRASMRESSANMLVANDLDDMNKGHIAYIISQDNNIITVKGKDEIANKLLLTIAQMISK
jgi:phosphopantothenoylcysteine decarboxylase/phosphopantothenate--cysteine ligase